jgi:hypothetical protein
MSRLKDENLKQCFSLLREYIEGTPQDSKKRIAILALDQLQNITAGGVSVDYSRESCNGKPRAYESPFN